MSAAHPDPIRLVPTTPPRAARRSGRRAHLGVVSVAVAAMIVAIAASLWSRSGGVRTLPREERAALLSRMVEELRQYCTSGHPAALDDHCRELASFAAQFEECRGDCEALVRPWLTPSPTR